MFTARVIGNVWATRKHARLEKCKLLLVQPIEPLTGAPQGDPALAVDGGFGAGPGDAVLVMDEGGSARQILKDPAAPVRLIICGIVDAASRGASIAHYH